MNESSSKFVLTCGKVSASPAFYQYATDIVFKELIQIYFPVASQPIAQKSTTITNTEANVIRYAAGYTLRTLRRKIEASSHPLKEEMVSALMELVLDNKDDAVEQEHATEWINLVDGGGLWHIKSGTFLFFCAIEEELHSYLTVSSVKELSAGMKHTITVTIIDSDNVAFYWCMLCTDAEEKEKKELRLS